MTITEFDKSIKIKSSSDVANIFHTILQAEQEQDQIKEHFWIACLNPQNQIQFLELVSIGSMTSSLVHPREVFRMAIIKNSASIILCHNHPSGVLESSFEDSNLTKRLVEGGKILGIQVLDHLIIDGKGGYISMMEKGQI